LGGGRGVLGGGGEGKIEIEGEVGGDGCEIKFDDSYRSINFYQFPPSESENLCETIKTPQSPRLQVSGPVSIIPSLETPFQLSLETPVPRLKLFSP